MFSAAVNTNQQQVKHIIHQKCIVPYCRLLFSTNNTFSLGNITIIGPLNISDHHCSCCHCPNHHYHQHHCVLLLLLLSASSQDDCACDEKATMHTKWGCAGNAALRWERKTLWSCQLCLNRSPLPLTLSLFLPNCISVCGTKGTRGWGINKAEPPEALHSQAAWEPAASAKTPAEGKSETERWGKGGI